MQHFLQHKHKKPLWAFALEIHKNKSIHFLGLTKERKKRLLSVSLWNLDETRAAQQQNTVSVCMCVCVYVCVLLSHAVPEVRTSRTLVTNTDSLSMMSPSVLCSPVTTGDFIIQGTAMALQKVCVFVWLCIQHLDLFPKCLAVVWIIYSIWPWNHSVLQTLWEKCLPCINYSPNGHEKVIIIIEINEIWWQQVLWELGVSSMSYVPERSSWTSAERLRLMSLQCCCCCCWHWVVPHLPVWQELPVASSTQREEGDEDVERGRGRCPTWTEDRRRWGECRHQSTFHTGWLAN